MYIYCSKAFKNPQGNADNAANLSAIVKRSREAMLAKLQQVDPRPFLTHQEKQATCNLIAHRDLTPSVDDGFLYQSNPNYASPKGRQSSFTDSILAYHKIAHRISERLIANSYLVKYRFYSVVKVKTDLGASQHKKLWSKTVKNLRRHGINGFYSREIEKNNRVHYNLIILTAFDNAEQAKAIIRQSLPQGWQSLIHVWVEPVGSSITVSRYIMKAGWQWEDKRVLFKPNCKLEKHGTIGTFWAKPLPEIDEQVKAERVKYFAKQELENEIISHATMEQREEARKLWRMFYESEPPRIRHTILLNIVKYSSTRVKVESDVW